MKRLLVTGWDGFVGRVLGDSLRFSATARYELITPMRGFELREPDSVERAVSAVQPDYVIHLAAQSFVPDSLADPRATYEINFMGTFNLLNALRSNNFSGRLLYVSSGDVYGLVPPEDLPVTESRAVQPRNPYSVSKAAAELLCLQWVQTAGFDIVVARPFNHVGPGQSQRFVVSDFAKQIVESKLGVHPPVLSVGSIDTTRDMTDVRDVVRAYLQLIENGIKGEVYNVCSGQELSIRGILDKLMAFAQIDCRIVQDAARTRPSEQKRMCGSFKKLNSQTGWEPAIPIDQSLRDLLSFWESRLKNA